MPLIEGIFPVPKPNPKPSVAPWDRFRVESNITIDLATGEARGNQGLVRTDGVQTSSEPFVVQLTAEDIAAMLGVVLARAKAVDTMGVYDDPAWNGAPIVMTVDGVPV